MMKFLYAKSLQSVCVLWGIFTVTGFDALHDELGPPSQDGTLDRTYVRDYVKGYQPEADREVRRAESENASETTSLHEEEREGEQ